jgi:exonuclease SbcC
VKPTKLTLTGFLGVTSGRGKDQITLDLTTVPQSAQLVALVGPNGAGKTTLMDNLHPYRIMPSRASDSMTPSGFSYYDNVGESASKELFWCHNGIEYRTLVTLKASGKTKRQEAYLFVKEMGQFVPCSIDGLTSDGKTDVYDRLVESILGKPEIFFMTQFSAQGKRSLSAMRVTEVKELLVSMLGGEKIKALSEKASEVVKSLRPHLAALQQQALPAQQKASGEQSTLAEVSVLTEKLKAYPVGLAELDDQVSELIQNLGQAKARLSQNASIALQHDSIRERIAALQGVFKTDQEKIATKHAATVASLVSQLAQVKVNGKRESELLTDVKREISVLEGLVGTESELTVLVGNMSGIRDKLRTLELENEVLERKVQPLTTLREEANRLLEILTQTKSDGSALADAITIAQATAKLIGQVPCQGTAMQTACPLLAKANEAQEGLPRQESAKEVLLTKYKSAKSNHLVATNVIAGLIEDEAKLKSNQQAITQLANQMTSCREAKVKLEQVVQGKLKLENLRVRLNDLVSQIDGLRIQCASLESQIAQSALLEQKELAERTVQNEADYAALQVQQASLPSLVQVSDVQAIESEIAEKKLLVKSLEDARANDQVQLMHLQSQLNEVQDAKAFIANLDDQAKAIADEIAYWTLMEKAFGNDGIIALSIDDAGPAVSTIANNLLRDCYGGRFQVRLDTQKATATGKLKETFQIMVADTHRGEHKELEQCSGGEKVWVNECLVRAFALYMSGASGKQFDTLFGDETDGALDPERKRHFLAMKRSVLKEGGYSREYLITQTPELWDAVDHVIDVTTL